MASSYVSYQSGTLSGGLTYYVQTATNSITTSSETFQETGLSITPPLAGSYLVIYRGSMFAEGSGATIGQIRLATQQGATTTAIANTVGRTRNTVVMVLGLIGGNNVDGSGSMTMAVVNVDGNTTVKAQYARGSSGTNITLAERSIILIKVG